MWGVLGPEERHIEREDEERVVRRLTVAGPRGARGEEDGAQEAGGGGARHQPSAVLGEQQERTVRRGVAREWRRTWRAVLPLRRLEQRAHPGRARLPRCCPQPRYNPLPPPHHTHVPCRTHRMSLRDALNFLISNITWNTSKRPNIQGYQHEDDHHALANIKAVRVPVIILGTPMCGVMLSLRSIKSISY